MKRRKRRRRRVKGRCEIRGRNMEGARKKERGGVTRIEEERNRIGRRSERGRGGGGGGGRGGGTIS